MNLFNGFSYRTNRAIEYSVTSASCLGHTYVGSEHLLLGLLRLEEGEVYELLSRHGIYYPLVRQRIIEKTGCGVPTTLSERDFSLRFNRIISNSMLLADSEKRLVVGTAELFSSLLQQTDCNAVRLLNEMDMTQEKIMKASSQFSFKVSLQSTDFDKNRKAAARSSRSVGRTGLLEKYSVDLTAQVTKCWTRW